MLVSQDFIYFGAEGQEIPEHLKAAGLVRIGRGRKKIKEAATIAEFENWMASLGEKGYRGRPFDMVEEAKRRK